MENRSRDSHLGVGSIQVSVLTNKYSTIWDQVYQHLPGRRTVKDTRKVFAKDKVAVTLEKYHSILDADIRNILGNKKSNTEKIELIADLLKMLSKRHVLPQLEGDPI
jgi:hypothetical protein